MHGFARSTAAILALGLLAAGCGSSSRRGGPAGTTTPGATASTGPQGLPGSYLGSYASGSGQADSGQVGLIVFPDLSFSAIAVSAVDESVRESAQGSLNPDGTIRSIVTWGGTSFTLDLTRLSGTYASNLSTGSFTLRRAPAGGAVGCYFGTTTNLTLGITGQWMGVVDEQDRMFALYYYPHPVPYLSEGVYGTVAPDAAGGWTVSASNTSNAVIGQGSLSAGGWFSGTWDSPSQGQSGTWTGTRNP